MWHKHNGSINSRSFIRYVIIILILIYIELIDEIIHSRDSFVEIYKQFYQRQHNVQSSMQFSGMPTTLNFCMVTTFE